MKKAQFLTLLFLLANCNSLNSGADYDNNEYLQSVKLQVLINQTKEFCGKSRKDLQGKINQIDYEVKILKLYSSGFEHNESIVNQIVFIQKDVDKLISKLANRNISENYCQDKLNNLELTADILRKSIALKDK